jgi:hypothetical protein
MLRWMHVPIISSMPGNLKGPIGFKYPPRLIRPIRLPGNYHATLCELIFDSYHIRWDALYFFWIRNKSDPVMTAKKKCTIPF